MRRALVIVSYCVTLILHIKSLRWTLMTINNNVIPGKYGISGGYFPQTNEFITWGGSTMRTRYMNDFYTINMASMQCTALGSTSQPSARTYASSTHNAATGDLYVYGGYTGTATLGDFYRLTVSSKSWTRISTAGPPSRYLSCIQWDSNQGRIVLFGGYDGFINTYYNDMWTYSTTWTQEMYSGGSIVGRLSHACASNSISGEFYVHGGAGSGSASFGDLNQYDFKLKQWKRLDDGRILKSRDSHKLIHLASINSLLIFGGIGSDGEIYRFDLSATVTQGWTIIPVEAGTDRPGGSNAPADGLDPQTNTYYIFGGDIGSSTYLHLFIR
jgi:hypothetical protein